MKTFKTIFGIAVSVGFLAVSSTSVFGLNVILTMDESGNAYVDPSQPLPYTIGTDPVSGMNTLEYTLPFVGVAGDVLLQEVAGGPLSDILRFDGNSHAFFFSDNSDGVDSLADVGLPSQILANNAGPFLETGTEGGFQNYMYTPTATGPGAVGNGTVYTYNIISDVPEPSIALLGVLGGGMLLLLGLRRQVIHA